MSTVDTKLDELLSFHAQGRMGAISLAQHDKVQKYTKQQIKSIILAELMKEETVYHYQRKVGEGWFKAIPTAFVEEVLKGKS